ncbi:17491_t:CDS:2 [Funneliformis caledonium]|uniref:17491_t:CDS:1 n=1 Tax=Funneliformis caledonium TaxID=1117310 RepID=A0A9N9FNX7_9GLOM|nr:17491_t:CDS:2 [Funneliformis caledonium]
MSTSNATNYGTVKNTSSPKVMGIANFTKWVKVAILRKPPNQNHILYRSTKVRRSSSIKRSVSTNKVSSTTNPPLTNSPLPKSRNFIRHKSNKLVTPRDKRAKSLINDVECAGNNSWIDQEEPLDKDEMIIPGLKPALIDMYEMPAVISNRSPRQQPPSPNYDSNDVIISRVGYLENTNIVKGSVEHFAYLRSVRKLRVGKRPISQALSLNKILAKLSSQVSDKVHKELIHYKRVYELNRQQDNNNHNGSPSSLPNKSCTNQRLSVILSGVHKSPITMKYRPSYATSKVVTVFDDELNQLVVKELPMARRRKRLNSLTNTLEPDIYLSDIIEISDDEDDVPLFVLKEQFRYSGRGPVSLKNFMSSVEDNKSSHLTLAV